MNETFQIKKKIALEKLNQALELKRVDLEVLDLINLINSFPDYYTTSSCAGRIVILTKDSFRGKYSANFVFKKHGITSFDELHSSLEPASLNDYKKMYFNVEPPTFHIAAKSLEDAIKIHELAISSEVAMGYSMFKTIKKTIVVEIRGTGMLQVPIGQDNQLKIDNEYLKFILELGNNILADEQKRMSNLYNELQVWKSS